MENPCHDDIVAMHYKIAKESFERWRDIWENTETYRKQRREINRSLAVAMVIGGIAGIVLAKYFMGLIIK